MSGRILVDAFSRRIDYLRMSVTDRCDFRCIYCMTEEMEFLPRNQVMSLDEIYRVAESFVALGTRKIRLTGGEPLIRPGVVGLCERIAALPGLKELCMTTNGSHLKKLAQPLIDSGLSRLNISLDSLAKKRFGELTRTGSLCQVIEGIDAALAAGFKNTKLNCVIMKGRNDGEINDLIRFAIDRKLDISFIEEMPLGAITEHSRAATYFTSEQVHQLIAQQFTLLQSTETTNGPSRYWKLAEAPGIRVGFIFPQSHNFCDSCNRVRLTAEGLLVLCLGHERAVDLMSILRGDHSDRTLLEDAIIESMKLKPDRHGFQVSDDVQVVRLMNMTGG